MVPQQWLCATTAPALRQTTGAVLTWSSTVHCYGRSLVLQRNPCVAADPNGQLQPGPWRTMVPCCGSQSGASDVYPELSSGGPQRLRVLGSEIGGRWNKTAQQLVRGLGARASPTGRRHCEPQPPPPGRGRWWATLAVAVQQAVSSTALGSPWPAPPHASQLPGPELDRVSLLEQGHQLRSQPC